MNKYLFFILVLIAILILFFAAQQEQSGVKEREINSPEQAYSQEPATNPNIETTKTEKGLNSETPESIQFESMPASTAFIESENLEEFFSEYEILAESGDVDAQYYLSKAFSECLHAKNRDYAQQIEIVNSLERSGYGQAFIDQSWREFNRCESLRLNPELDSLAKKFRAMATEAKHPAIVSENLNELLKVKGEHALFESEIPRLLESQNYEAIMNIGRFIGQYLSNRSNPQLSSTAENAFLIASCSFNNPMCKPGSSIMQVMCGDESALCDPNQDIIGYLYDHSLSPSEAMRVSELVPMIMHAVNNNNYNRIYEYFDIP